MSPTRSRYLSGAVALALAISVTMCDSNPVVDDRTELKAEVSHEIVLPGGVEPMGPAIGNKLLYSPPTTSCTKNVGPNWPDTAITLSNSCSWRVNLPSTPMTAQLRIIGGKDIVIIGGASNLQPGGGTAALSFYDNGNTASRTIHVEGVLFDQDAPWDAIVFDTPKASLQLQNIRIQNVHGVWDPPEHGDAVQNWGGAEALRIHKMSVTTTYQGINLNGNPEDSIGYVSLREVDLAPGSKGSGPPLYLMMTDGWGDCGDSDFVRALSSVYIVPTVSWEQTYPSDSGPIGCFANLNGSVLTWPNWPDGGNKITGAVYKVSSAKNFVPVGVAGLNYVSPGYF